MLRFSKMIWTNPEALLRMAAPEAGFRGVTLYDVTPFIKIMSKSW